jgi:hypothetical protein
MDVTGLYFHIVICLIFSKELTCLQHFLGTCPHLEWVCQFHCLDDPGRLL